MKRVNPKWIKISDEIEKRAKRGLLYILRFTGEGNLGGVSIQGSFLLPPPPGNLIRIFEIFESFSQLSLFDPAKIE
ncbi:hypothetical protein [Parabacteroides sp. AF48-14]|uniref:hypothetical protein n=1 Tax=Parabacteroides sp. AF48-14 TaxID=2292052 RepID=UPI000EFE21E6|nr:hypothetical protein [Parabacteroides sp. AF48-14]